MTFSDAQFNEFMNNPRIKREWDNLSNGTKHRQQEEQPVRVTAQVFAVDMMGNVSPLEHYND